MAAARCVVNAAEIARYDELQRKRDDGSLTRGESAEYLNLKSAHLAEIVEGERKIKDELAEAKRRPAKSERAKRAPPPPGADAPPPHEGKPNGHDKTEPVTLDLAPFAAAMIDMPLTPTAVLVSELIPANCVTVITADGGAGKGILMQMLCTCAAARVAFVGRAVTCDGSAIFISGEDTTEQLRNRHARICRALDIDERDPDMAKALVLKSVADREFYVWRDGKPTFDLLALNQALEDLPDSVVVLDGVSTMYDDEEISRRRVSAFIRAINRIAAARRCTIILVAHTSRSSDDSVSRMSSGSTAWIYQARAALQLKSSDGGATLTLVKANHLKPGLKIDLRWTDDGVLMAKDAPTGVLAVIGDRNDDKAVLDAITMRWNDPHAEPLTKAANMRDRYLPRFMGRQHGWSAGRAEKAMVRLIDARLASTGKTTKNGKAMSGLCPILREK